jgi:hypothetical protein
MFMRTFAGRTLLPEYKKKTSASRRSRLNHTHRQRERFVHTLAKNVKYVQSKLHVLIAVDSCYFTACRDTGRIQGRTKKGQYIQVHAYAAISLGRDGTGVKSKLVFVSANMRGEAGFSGAEYVSEVMLFARVCSWRSSVPSRVAVHMSGCTCTEHVTIIPYCQCSNPPWTLQLHVLV